MYFAEYKHYNATCIHIIVTLTGHHTYSQSQKFCVCFKALPVKRFFTCVCVCVCVCSQGGGGEGLSAAPVCTDAVRGHTLLDGLEHTLHPRLPQTTGENSHEIHTNIFSPMDIHVYSQTRQPLGKSVCVCVFVRESECVCERE